MEGKIEITKEALREGLDIALITKITGLPKETIVKLKDELTN